MFAVKRFSGGRFSWIQSKDTKFFEIKIDGEFNHKLWCQKFLLFCVFINVWLPSEVILENKC